MFSRLLRLALAGLPGFVLPVSAAPFLPASDTLVLERLPISPADPVFRELRTLRAELAARPGNPDLAAKLAGRFFDLATAEGDPRYIGYAEAALQPWQSATSIPPNLQVIRGQLRQYRHDFAGALADFAAALGADASNTEARAWRAAIFMVQARYAEARAECAALAPYASELFSTGCIAYVDATTGRTRLAYEKLSAVLRNRDQASVSSRLWNLTRLAEMAQRLGDPAAAERHYRDALSLGVTDNFLLAAFADFLLDEKRPAEVVGLLRERTRSDTLLLRLALAESALGLPTAANRVRALEDRFAEAGLRKEQLHLQEEARFRLHLKEDPHGALKLAAENWRTQREPRDAGILLSAALAARDRKAGQPAIEWLEQSEFEDARLRREADALKALAR
jgi:Tfp pilus assembly protein PilF